MKDYDYDLYDANTKEIDDLTLSDKIVMLRYLLKSDSHALSNDPALNVFNNIEGQHNSVVEYLEAYTHINNSDEAESVAIVKIEVDNHEMYIRKLYNGNYEYIDEVEPKQVSTVEYVLKYY